MTFAGLDLDTHNVHVVLLDETTDDATYRRFPIDIGPGDYHARARRMSDLLPTRSAWRDELGVMLIAVEEPRTPHTRPGGAGGGFKAAIPQAVIRGAVLACLPREHDVPLLLMPPQEWKKWSLGGGFPGQGNAKKDAVAQWVKGRWPNRTTSDQNALDAYAIAFGARSLCQDAADRRGRAA